MWVLLELCIAETTIADVATITFSYVIMQVQMEPNKHLLYGIVGGVHPFVLV